MEAGRADSIKESQLENKPDLPPPSHCLLDEDVVEDLYEQDLPKGHSFTLRTRPHQGTQLYPHAINGFSQTDSWRQPSLIWYLHQLESDHSSLDDIWRSFSN